MIDIKKLILENAGALLALLILVPTIFGILIKVVVGSCKCPQGPSRDDLLDILYRVESDEDLAPILTDLFTLTGSSYWVTAGNMLFHKRNDWGYMAQLRSEVTVILEYLTTND